MLKTPTRSPSLSIGTLTKVRVPASSTNRQRITLAIGPPCHRVGDLDHLLGYRSATEPTCRTGTYDRFAFSLSNVCRRRVMQRDGAEALSFAKPERPEPGFAQPRRIGQNRVEHRLKVAERGCDDLQDLGRRGVRL